VRCAMRVLGCHPPPLPAGSRARRSRPLNRITTVGTRIVGCASHGALKRPRRTRSLAAVASLGPAHRGWRHIVVVRSLARSGAMDKELFGERDSTLAETSLLGAQLAPTD
jgi:hypothetical protein